MSLFRARYFPTQIPKDLNPGVTHYFANKSFANTRHHGQIVRTEEKAVEEMMRQFFSARRKVVLLSISSWERERPEKLAQERDEDSLGTHNHRNSEVCMLGRTCTRMQRY